MNAIVRGMIIYVFVYVMIRVSGKRTMADATPFDLMLMVIISETTQQALIGQDFSITNAMIVITTLVFMDIVLSLLKRRHPRLELWLDDAPLIIVRDGRPIRDRMEKSRVDEHDVLAAAREQQGLKSLEEIEYAVLERNGAISIIPRKDAGS